VTTGKLLIKMFAVVGARPNYSEVDHRFHLGHRWSVWPESAMRACLEKAPYDKAFDD
jgi:hypothetical protein